MIGSFQESSNLTTEYLRLTVQNKDLINVGETAVLEVDKSNKEIRTFLIEFYPGMTTATLNLTMMMSTNVGNSIEFKLVVDDKSINPEM